MLKQYEVRKDWLGIEWEVVNGWGKVVAVAECEADAIGLVIGFNALRGAQSSFRD